MDWPHESVPRPCIILHAARTLAQNSDRSRQVAGVGPRVFGRLRAYGYGYGYGYVYGMWARCMYSVRCHLARDGQMDALNTHITLLPFAGIGRSGSCQICIGFWSAGHRQAVKGLAMHAEYCRGLACTIQSQKCSFGCESSSPCSVWESVNVEEPTYGRYS